MEKHPDGRDPGIAVDLNIDDLLARVRYTIDAGRPHIVLNDACCGDCDHRSCLYVCPVRAYRWQENRIRLFWERCMECGACMHICDRQALSWAYPRGGFGVSYRLG